MSCGTLWLGSISHMQNIDVEIHFYTFWISTIIIISMFTMELLPRMILRGSLQIIIVELILHKFRNKDHFNIKIFLLGWQADRMPGCQDFISRNLYCLGSNPKPLKVHDGTVSKQLSGTAWQSIPELFE